MATIKLKSEKRLKQVDTSSEGANTYESGDVVYDSNGSKFRTSNGSAWSDLTVPASITDISQIGNVDSIGSDANRGKFLKVKSGADEIEYVNVNIPGAIGDLSDVAAIGSTNRSKILKVQDGADSVEYSQVDEAIAALYTITANGSSDYRFAGPGLTGSENDPTLYLVRGRKYQWYNNSGGHSLQFQTNTNGTVGTGGQIYTSGITFASGDDIDNGETATWEVMLDAPATLYYQCKSHTDMGGPIKILDASSGGATNLSIGTHNATTLEVVSSTGNNITLPQAGDSNKAGLMSDTDKDKLDEYPNFNSLGIGSLYNSDALGSNAKRGFVARVKTGSDALEFVDRGLPPAIGTDANRGKFLKVSDSSDEIVYSSENFMRPPMFSDEKTIANGASAHVNIEGDLNAGDGGILTVKNDQAAASGAAPGSWGVSVNTANLTADPASVKYEILASDNKQFKFAAVTTAIASFSGQAQINAGSDVTVTDSQKLVLAYTGSAWKYSVQSR